MWKKYGFACECMVACGIPFSINMDNQSLSLGSSGQLRSGPKENMSVSIIGNTLSVNALPVGCLSIALPRENLK